MIDLPPLPPPDNVWMIQGLDAIHSFHEKQMRSYGEACARAALERDVPDDWEAEYARFKGGAAFQPDWPALKVAFAVGMNFGRRAALEAAELAVCARLDSLPAFADATEAALEELRALKDKP